MKKAISILLVITMVFAMCGCNSEFFVVSNSHLSKQEFIEQFPIHLKGEHEASFRGPSFKLNISYKDDLDYNVYNIVIEQSGVTEDVSKPEAIHNMYRSIHLAGLTKLTSFVRSNDMFIADSLFLISIICKSEGSSNFPSSEELCDILAGKKIYRVGDWEIKCEDSGFNKQIIASCSIAQSGPSTIFN